MKCIQQVSAHGENTQPHPKRVADVTTKLLFARYTNHYAASEAKAPLAVVAVRSKPHRTRVTQLLHRNTQCQGSATLLPAASGESPLPRGQRDRSEWPRQWVGPWARFCPCYLPRTRQSGGTRRWSLGTPRPASRVSVGGWGVHTSYLAAFWSAGWVRKSYCQLAIESSGFKRHCLVPQKRASF